MLLKAGFRGYFLSAADFPKVDDHTRTMRRFRGFNLSLGNICRNSDFGNGFGMAHCSRR